MIPGLNNLLLTPDELSATFDGGMALLSAGGNLINTTRQDDFWTGINSALPGYLKSVSQNKNDPVFSKPLRIEKENKTLLLVAISTGSQNILIGAFTPDTLIHHTLMNSISSGQTSTRVIARNDLNGSFEVLYHAGPVREDETSNTHPGIEDSLNGDSGINYYHVGAEEHVVAFSPISPLGWGLVTEEAWEDIASPYLTSTQAAPFSNGSLIFAGLVGTLVWRTPHCPTPAGPRKTSVRIGKRQFRKHPPTRWWHHGNS